MTRPAHVHHLEVVVDALTAKAERVRLVERRLRDIASRMDLLCDERDWSNLQEGRYQELLCQVEVAKKELVALGSTR